MGIFKQRKSRTADEVRADAAHFATMTGCSDFSIKDYDADHYPFINFTRNGKRYRVAASIVLAFGAACRDAQETFDTEMWLAND
jgi:hypothetical protein